MSAYRSLLLVALLSAADTYAQPLPSRSDCIVPYKLDWSGIFRNPHDMLNSFEIPHQLAERLALAGMTTPTTEVVYLQFTEECDARVAKAEQIISRWRQIPDAPKFERMNVRVQPSPRTIDIRGPHWRD
jgi:hypothetical protein